MDVRLIFIPRLDLYRIFIDDSALTAEKIIFDRNEKIAGNLIARIS